MTYSVEDLRTLELVPGDLENLPEEQQKKKLRKHWSTLCLRYHPDKNPGYGAEFNAVMTAYNNLTKKEDNYLKEIHEYFQPETIDIPFTAFDLTQQEGINMAYERLLTDFSRLKTPKAKQAFANYYASFLNLARSLEAKQENFNKRRVDSLLFQATKETLSQRLQREWRIMILRLFAEEFLDDFQYRHAIATGDLYPILATVKLLSPIKLVVAVINTLILLAVSSSHYFFERILLHIMFDFFAHYSSVQTQISNNLKLSVKNIAMLGLLVLSAYVLVLSAYVAPVLTSLAVGLFLLYSAQKFLAQDDNARRDGYNKLKLVAKIFALIGILAVPAIYAPVLSAYAFGLPLIARILERLACPVNQLVRPLATRLSRYARYFVNDACTVFHAGNRQIST